MKNTMTIIECSAGSASGSWRFQQLDVLSCNYGRGSFFILTNLRCTYLLPIWIPKRRVNLCGLQYRNYFRINNYSMSFFISSNSSFEISPFTSRFFNMVKGSSELELSLVVETILSDDVSERLRLTWRCMSFARSSGFFFLLIWIISLPSS